MSKLINLPETILYLKYEMFVFSQALCL
nr:hypothetical protein BAR15_120169 [Bartonella sp. AR 15-3]